jgi:hypothetical protein
MGLRPSDVSGRESVFIHWREKALLARLLNHGIEQGIRWHARADVVWRKSPAAQRSIGAQCLFARSVGRASTAINVDRQPYHSNHPPEANRLSPGKLPAVCSVQPAGWTCRLALVVLSSSPQRGRADRR